MTRTTRRWMIVGAVLAFGGSALSPAVRVGTARVQAAGMLASGHYASVDGLKLYYEIHGTGQPLVLLHGGLGGIVEFGPLLPLLARTHQVIAVELQGHGHTADIARPLSYELMADDIAALIQQLGFARADLLGYSLGGEVALQTAIRHPDVVRKLVLISTTYQRSGWYPQDLAQEAASLNARGARAMVGTPVYRYYASVAPRPQDWPRFVTKVGQLLKQKYDWSQAVAAMKTPTLLVVGDGDRVRPEHALAMVHLLGGGRMDGGMSGFPTAGASAPPKAELAVLPATTHFTILSRTALLLPIITPFLATPRPAATAR